jgi:hypothetical protein
MNGMGSRRQAARDLRTFKTKSIKHSRSSQALNTAKSLAKLPIKSNFFVHVWLQPQSTFQLQRHRVSDSRSEHEKKIQFIFSNAEANEEIRLYVE